MSTFMMTPHEMTLHLAQTLQTKRLSLNISQQTLSARSGVSYGVLKKFERSGQISLGSLLKLALSLGSLEAFKDLFTADTLEHTHSLDNLIKKKPRKRGRI